VYVNHNSHSHGIDNEFTSPYSTTSFGSVGYHIPIFHLDEEILESLIMPYYPWDDMHHHSLFLPQKPTTFNIQYSIESKYFLYEHVFVISIDAPWYGDIITYLQT